MTGTFLKQIGSTDHGVGTSALGFGGRFVYNALPYLDLESDLIIWPNNQASAGTWIQGLFGAKVGQRFVQMRLWRTTPSWRRPAANPALRSLRATGTSIGSSRKR